MTRRLLLVNLWAWLVLTPALAMLLALALHRPATSTPDVFPAVLATAQAPDQRR